MNAHMTDIRRELPSNLEAEQALLGAIFVNNSALDAIPAALEPRHFYRPLHIDIFDAMKDLQKAGRLISPVTVKALVPSDMVEMIDHDGNVEKKPPAHYLARLASDAVNVGWAADFARTIMDCAARRACILLGDKMDEAAYSLDIDIMDEVDALRGKFEDVVRALNGPQKARTLADAARDALLSTSDAFQGKGVVGVDYGLPWLMGMIGPFMPGQEIIIGGGTKQGKTTLIEQIVAGAAMNGHPVWMNSGEMKDKELAHRALSRLTDIQAWRQIRGKVSEREYEQLETARRNAETWQDRVFIRDDSMTIHQIDREIADFSKRHPGALAIVDHIGLVERDRQSLRMSEAEFSPVVTRALKMTANKAQLPIIAAAQLKKNTFAIDDKRITKATFQAAISRRPKFGDIFGSCEKDANHVIIPFRAEPILQELEPAESSELYPIWSDMMASVKDKAEIIVALSRHTKWPQRKDVGWNGPKTVFVDMAQGDQGRMF